MRLSGKETDMLYGRLKDDLIEETRRQAGILGLDPGFYEEFIRNSDAIINGDFKSAKFSDRIWANGYKMRGNLQSGIHNSMLLGDNPRTWARKLEENLSEEMDDTGKQNAFYNAFRLSVTESARVQVNTGLKLMRKSGYEKYIWIAEPGACHICAPFNDHVFDIENSDIGDELPPMHPFCRCSIAAYYNMDEEIDIDEKARELAEELGYSPLSDSVVVPVLRSDSMEWIEELTSEEKSSISKYTYNGKDSDGLRLFEKINGYLENRYTPIDEKEKEIILRNAYNINKGLLKNELKHDIIVYRKENGIDRLNDVLDRFLSTSVSKRGVFTGNPNVAIIVPKGTNGAYIELLAEDRYKKQREFLFNSGIELNNLYNEKGINIFEVKNEGKRN